MKTTARILVGAALACSSLGCGTLGASRAVRIAAETDSNCPSEQIHVKGKVEGEGCVYAVDVCGRDRLYEDVTPDDGEWKFERSRKRAGAESAASTWAEHDGVEAPSPEAPPPEPPSPSEFDPSPAESQAGGDGEDPLGF